MKQALVTGGSHPLGIGWHSALSLVQMGYQVLVTGHSEAEIAGTPKHDQIRVAVLDVRDAASVKSLIGGLGGLDALVNCAGVASLNEFDPHIFANTIDVNLNGTMYCCAAAQPLLSASGGGAIVNIASMYAIFGSAEAPGYAASKGGVVQLTKSLAAAWAMQNIRVNAVAPGWISTAMAKPALEDLERRPILLARTPMGRFGDPAELGDVIAFLCSHAARFVTGVTIPVDGGYSISG